MDDDAGLIEALEAAQYDVEASKRAFEAIYKRLRSFAGSVRRPNQTQATGMVHDAYIKLYQGGRAPNVNDQVHFLRLCFKVIMNLLRDHARRLKAVRHGGESVRVVLMELEQGISVEANVNDTLLDFERIMAELAATGKDGERAADAARFRFVLAMEQDEIGQAMGLTKSQVRTALNRAQTLLNERLGTPGHSGGPAGDSQVLR